MKKYRLLLNSFLLKKLWKLCLLGLIIIPEKQVKNVQVATWIKNPFPTLDFMYLFVSKNVRILCLSLLLATYSSQVNAQNCTANTGGNAVVSGSTTTLNGAVLGTLGAGTPTWTFVSGPTMPTIVSPTALSTSVTGMIDDGAYVFQLSRACGTGTSISNVTITAHPRPAFFTASADIAGTICASLSGAYNLYIIGTPCFTSDSIPVVVSLTSCCVADTVSPVISD